MAGKSRIFNKIQDDDHFGFLQLLAWQQQVINRLLLSTFIANETIRKSDANCLPSSKPAVFCY